MKEEKAKKKKNLESKNTKKRKNEKIKPKHNSS